MLGRSQNRIDTLIEESPQTFNHLKKGDQDLSGAVCEDVL